MRRTVLMGDQTEFLVGTTWRRFRSERSRRACHIRRWSRACCTSTPPGASKRS